MSKLGSIKVTAQKRFDDSYERDVSVGNRFWIHMDQSGWLSRQKIELIVRSNASHTSCATTKSCSSGIAEKSPHITCSIRRWGRSRLSERVPQALSIQSALTNECTCFSISFVASTYRWGVVRERTWRGEDKSRTYIINREMRWVRSHSTFASSIFMKYTDFFLNLSHLPLLSFLPSSHTNKHWASLLLESRKSTIDILTC